MLMILLSLSFIIGPTDVYNHESSLTGHYKKNVIQADTLKEHQDSLTAELRLDEGKKRYKKNCGKCHLLYEPRDFKLSVWKKNLDEMTEKADLSETDHDLILLYLAANCKKK